MASRLWLIAPLLVVVAVASAILFAGFGIFLWRLLASLFRAMTGGYCPTPLC
ncbi:MAG TPA: hypothetical protein VEH86_03485 [Candidatus Acidoferrum sp.]|nr:hypothetical protein [Candidatus Acidoferrum sp.]